MKTCVKKFFKKNLFFLLILLAILFYFVYSYLNQGVVYSLFISDSQAIIDLVNSFGFFAGLIFIFLVILEVIIAPIPPLILYIAGGFLFGTFIGGTLTLLGNLIGAGIDFHIARTFGRGFVEKKVSEKTRKKFDAFSKKYGFATLFLLRLNPFTSSDLFSYLSGLTKMKMKTFLIATGFGLIPIVFIQTYIGEAIIKNNPFLSLILILVSLIYLLIFIYLIFRSLKRKHS